MEWFWEQYLEGDEDAASPYILPLRAKDLSGLPRTLVITADADPLRDDGEAYADRLTAAGVEVELVRFEGVVDMFYLLAGILPNGDVAFDKAQATLQDMFAPARNDEGATR